MRSTPCALNGCRQRVRDDYTYTPYCYNHRSYSGQYAKSNSTVTSVRDQMPPPKRAAASVREQTVSSYTAQTPISSDLVRPILDSITEVEGDVDLSIPAEAEKNIPGRLARLRSSLIVMGVDPDRITMMKLHGLHRKVPGDTRQRHNPSVDHYVLVMDSGTDREAYVDPSIAALAPVANRRLPVDEQFPSGMTPYGDSPWIGSQDGYVNGAFLWWDEVIQPTRDELPMEVDLDVSPRALERPRDVRRGTNMNELNW